VPYSHETELGLVPAAALVNTPVGREGLSRAQWLVLRSSAGGAVRQSVRRSGHGLGRFCLIVDL
jgi:hypothetical protein